MQKWQTTRWCFTNYQVKAIDWEKLISSDIAFIRVGQEICPKTKRRHEQGFAYFHQKKASFKVVAELLHVFGTGKVFKCKGDIQSNLTYCAKEGDYQDYGVMPCQGEHTDIVILKDAILDGKMTADDVAVENPQIYHQYGRTLSRLETIFMRKRWRTEETKGFWYFGGTGVGKTSLWRVVYHPDTHFVKDLKNDWWDGK
jgi:hypothetical protein